MDAFTIITVVILGLGALAAIGAQTQMSGLKQKFAALGIIAGRSRADIVAIVGPPNSFSGLPDGKTLLQWQHTSQAGAYHIALRFDANDICEGVTHEFST